MDYKAFVQFVRELYNSEEFIPLHAPVFRGNEKKYLLETIDSTFVSSVGAYVNKFEDDIVNYTGAKYAIAVVNGTSALHMALVLAGVKPGDLVITQALSFVATANAISYTGADPVFLDIDMQKMSLGRDALSSFLEEIELVNGSPIHKPSGKKVSACVPMHTYGFPGEIDIICDLCAKYNIPVVEDSAESIGSFYKGKHTGTFGKLGVFSFNGNKTITCGGGGIVVTDDESIAKLGKHLTTQAKTPHKWDFYHDHIGYNYRCPNLNAALACAQLEQLEEIVENKRATAESYRKYFEGSDIEFFTEPGQSRSNYWLNTIFLKDKTERDAFLTVTNENGVMTRPAWTLLNELPMFQGSLHDGLQNSRYLVDRLVNLPSSVR
ncbi:MAG: LegC family aminotransferase [Bacteroidota bacterium]